VLSMSAFARKSQKNAEGEWHSRGNQDMAL
jgi:hypothetical protein